MTEARGGTENRLRGAEQAIATLFERQSQESHAINEKLDSVIEAVKDHRGTILTRQDTTNGEVAKLKLWQNRVIGAVGVLMSLLAVFGVYLIQGG